MEPFTLASTAVMALVPYLSIAGEGAAKKIGEDAVDGGESCSAGCGQSWVRGGKRRSMISPLDPTARITRRTCASRFRRHSRLIRLWHSSSRLWSGRAGSRLTVWFRT